MLKTPKRLNDMMQTYKMNNILTWTDMFSGKSTPGVVFTDILCQIETIRRFGVGLSYFYNIICTSTKLLVPYNLVHIFIKSLDLLRCDWNPKLDIFKLLSRVDLFSTSHEIASR